MANKQETFRSPIRTAAPQTLPSPPSEKEAKFYYSGLPSSPPLVARTGPPWKAPSGPEAYRKIRELRPVGNHALKEVWEDNLALKVHALLDSIKVKWTSTDVVRIGRPGKPSAPVILWIGMLPASLSADDGVVVASKCRELLGEHDIVDVDVEIRESVVTPLAGPKLLTSAKSSDATVDVREPLTSTLGLPICAQSTPWVEGTGGFFIAEGGRLLLVTTRHVVFTPDNKNVHFDSKNDSQPRYNVTLFGDAAFNKYLDYIQDTIRCNSYDVEYQERCVMGAEGEDNPAANELRQVAQRKLDKAREGMEQLNTFYEDVSTRWATPESRVLGHVILSPPINVGVGSEGYTEDWAVIEIDASKVDASNFNGNAIDLGTHIPMDKFTLMVCPNWSPQNPHSFKYPLDRLLRLKGTIPDEDMRHPNALDQKKDPFLTVIKRGNTTGLTIGRANDICSYVRYYYEGGNNETSKEWAILPFDSKSGAFSEKGDSGSVIIDTLGRIGGLLTSGAGFTSSSASDVTYATPISFLLKRIQGSGLLPPSPLPFDLL